MYLILALLLFTSGCTAHHVITLPEGKQVTQECKRWFIPWYAIVAAGVISFETSCHIVEQTTENVS